MTLTRVRLRWLEDRITASPKLALLPLCGGESPAQTLQGHWNPRLINVHGKQRNFDTGSDRKVSQHTVQHSLLRMVPGGQVPMLSPLHPWESLQRTNEHQNRTMEQRQNMAWSLFCSVCRLPERAMAPGWDESKPADAVGCFRQ